MNIDIILKAIKEVEAKINDEVLKWNMTNNPNIIEECIWNIQSLEIKRNNLYKEAKLLALQREAV